LSIKNETDIQADTNKNALFSKKKNFNLLEGIGKFILLQPLTRVSPIRPAPVEIPQGLTAARVDGCSGAIWIAYPPAGVAQLARAADL